ncbi:tRNA-specific adenosine deaminase TAD3-like isoform X1 [Syzygium oleosum]|uniref:tRNA-specific adenosine deaminase TAD3-like isoform X1 n=2 Tax=Syzygium oleosum TaxID=219896 RepID=UPI0011D2142F|nr:tRNA-specific adenosine deaminase TAD3-like isoform X1 [Syzygium oleosum]
MSGENGAWRIVHVPGRPPVPPDQQLTVDVVAAQIEQPKLTNTIIRRLSQIAPLEDLHHVKRVKKKCLEGGKIQLSVILCLASENGDFDGIPCDVKDVINSYQLSPFVAKVCKYAASSKEEWVEQCKLWPTSYHPPTYNISGITGFSEEDSRSVVSFMNYALELAKSHGNVVVNAAAIVDPLSNQVIARACDEVCSWHTPKTEVGAEFSSSTKSPADMTGWIKHELGLQRCSSGGPEQVATSISCLHPRWWVDEQTRRSSSFWHPLRHAVMVAIESSAARDRCLFPDVRYKDEATKEECILSPAKSQAKRRKTDGTDVDDGDKNDDAHGNGDLSSRPYLCTGNDIYLVWEPCTMCAMALVHQRIRRVFYAFPNPSAGALGSVHRLQGQKSLNHHYAVFRVVMPQDILDKAKTSICGS